MKLAIMQPYVFPYIGYFQLLHAVDKFVFYDDVNFIKKGWINRNRILLHGDAHLINIPCRGVSQNKLICEIEIDITNKGFNKIISSIDHAYRNAPYYDAVMPLILEVFYAGKTQIAEFAINSIKTVANYLGLQREYRVSSRAGYGNRGLERADRLIDICKKENATHYVNPVGGMELYTKSYFAERDIHLSFLEPKLKDYQQFKDSFLPGLSMIDVLMFNDIEQINQGLLSEYTLV